MRNHALRAAVLALLLLPAEAGAQPRSALGGWTLDLTSYGWLPAMDGTVGASALRAKVSNSFIDTVRESDSVLGFSARGELRRGRLGLFVDGMYSALGYDDVRAGPATLDATTVLGMLEFGAAYEIAGGRFGGLDRSAWALDGLGGGRWMYLRNKVFLVGVAGGSSTSDWVDPFVGARFRGRFGDRWEYALRGDVGGGVGGSRFAWQTSATLGYRFEMFGLESTAILGYRALSEDFHSAKLVYDVVMHGPVVGLNLRF
jgi:hypothetical protein